MATTVDMTGHGSTSAILPHTREVAGSSPAWPTRESQISGFLLLPVPNLDRAVSGGCRGREIGVQGTVARFPSPARRRPKVNCPHPPDKVPDGLKLTRGYGGWRRASPHPPPPSRPRARFPLRWCESRVSQKGRPGLHLRELLSGAVLALRLSLLGRERCLTPRAKKWYPLRRRIIQVFRVIATGDRRSGESQISGFRCCPTRVTHG